MSLEDMREKVSKEEISEDEIYQPHPNFKDHELDGGLRVPGELWSCLFDYQKTCMFDTHNVHLLFIYLFKKKKVFSGCGSCTVKKWVVSLVMKWG